MNEQQIFQEIAAFFRLDVAVQYDRFIETSDPTFKKVYEELAEKSTMMAYEAQIIANREEA